MSGDDALVVAVQRLTRAEERDSDYRRLMREWSVDIEQE